jgi:phage protein U
LCLISSSTSHFSYVLITQCIMNNILLVLGTYRFAIDTATYQTLKRHQSYRWQSQERLLRSPAQQFVGLGEDTITLSGVIYPHYRSGLDQLNDLRKQAGSGEPLLLIDGLGYVWGQWVSTQSRNVPFCPK